MSRLETKRPTASRSNAAPIMLVVGLLLGLLLGYGLSFLLGGSGGYATPSDLSPTAQAFWVRMTADSLAVTGNEGQARVFMNLFSPEEQSRLLGQEIAAAQDEDDVARLERLSQLGQALTISPQLPSAEGEEAPGTTPAATDTNALAQLLMACGGALLLLLLLVGGAIVLTRSRQASAPPPRDRSAIRGRAALDESLPALPSPDEEEEDGIEDFGDEFDRAAPEPVADAPAATAAPSAPTRTASWHVQDSSAVTGTRPAAGAADLPALDSFQARYSFGDDDFDVQFAIEDTNTEFLGECGVGAAELLDGGSPTKVTAVELWLFDKADVRTVSKILLSEHAWHDPKIKNELAARGELVPIREGAVVEVETKMLRVRAHVRELEYGSGGPSRHSFFERLAIDLTPEIKG